MAALKTQSVQLRNVDASSVLGVASAGRNSGDITDTEPERKRRIKDSDFAQALRRIFKTTNIYENVRSIGRDARIQVDVAADRLDASEAAFQAKRTDDNREKLELLLVSETLYRKALAGTDKMNTSESAKQEIADHINRSLKGVLDDIEDLEGRIVMGACNEMRVRIKAEDITILSPETVKSMKRLIKDLNIDRLMYRTLSIASYVGTAVSMGAAFLFASTQTVTLPIAGGAFALGSRLWWKASGKRAEMLAVKEALDDRVSKNNERLEQLNDADIVAKKIAQAREDYEIMHEGLMGMQRGPF